VMRWGEHVAQTTRPHFLQWCFLYKKLKPLPHTGHCETWASGCHAGSTMSLTLLAGAALDDWGYGGSGGSGRDRAGAGDESSRMGSEVELPALFECILMLDGLRMGDSAVVRRRLRSELRDDEESGRCEERLGRANRDDDGRDCWVSAGEAWARDW
jgi:hypothetical protein